nr:reverse transcriptase domain-containing protein [Tanacetum cinerariifolium]
MALKRTTKLSPTTTTTTTTLVTHAKLKVLIDQGVADALAARDADRSRNGKDNHDSRTGVRRQAPLARECTYLDFMKYKPLYFKGTKGVAELTQWMFPEESDKIEWYVGGLPDMIHEIEFATELMDKKICTFAKRHTENKRKTNNNKTRGRTLVWLTLLGLSCHLDRNCRSPTNANTANNQRGTRAGQKATCFECEARGHFKRECPKLKNNNHDNQGGNGNAPAKVYVVGNAGTNLDSNVVTGTFLLNNRYSTILFDTGADRIFVSTTFSSQIDITPTTLDHYYNVELADRRIVGLNTIIRGCTLNLLNHPFNIDLMPKELGSFDVIISMDWLAKYQADFLGLPTTQKVEFQIDLVPGAAPVAQAPYRLAPSEMKELLDQLQELSKKGLVGYYQRFIEVFFNIAKSMTKLTQKGVKFDWGNKEEAAFRVPFDGLQVDDKFYFVEEPIEIMDQEVKRMKLSRILIVKVRWNSRRGPNFIREREHQFWKKYRHLFTKTAPSSSAAS